MADKNKKVNLDILGSIGLPQFAGYVLDELLPELQLQRGRLIWRQMMDNDPVVVATLRAIEMLMRQVKWQMTPADKSSKAEEAAIFVDECLHDMSETFEDTMAEILTMLPYGWMLAEKLFKVRGGKTNDPTTYSRFT